MAKQLNVSLSFTADANAAKREIQSLQQTLNNLAKFGTTGLPIGNEVLKLNEDLREGMHAAAELQAKLESAVNVKTGKLDLNRFNSSLKQGKTSLQDYAISLSKLGEQGVEAFNQVANAIVHAEAPIFRVNSKIRAWCFISKYREMAIIIQYCPWFNRRDVEGLLLCAEFKQVFK